MKLFKQREKAEFDASLVKCELNKPDTNAENSLHRSVKTPNKTVVDSHFEKPFQERLNLTPFTNKFLPGNNDSEVNFHTDKTKQILPINMGLIVIIRRFEEGAYRQFY